MAIKYVDPPWHELNPELYDDGSEKRPIDMTNYSPTKIFGEMVTRHTGHVAGARALAGPRNAVVLSTETVGLDLQLRIRIPLITGARPPTYIPTLSDIASPEDDPEVDWNAISQHPKLTIPLSELRTKDISFIRPGDIIKVHYYGNNYFSFIEKIDGNILAGVAIERAKQIGTNLPEAARRGMEAMSPDQGYTAGLWWTSGAPGQARSRWSLDMAIWFLTTAGFTHVTFIVDYQSDNNWERKHGDFEFQGWSKKVTSKFAEFADQLRYNNIEVNLMVRYIIPSKLYLNSLHKALPQYIKAIKPQMVEFDLEENWWHPGRSLGPSKPINFTGYTDAQNYFLEKIWGGVLKRRPFSVTFQANDGGPTPRRRRMAKILKAAHMHIPQVYSQLRRELGKPYNQIRTAYVGAKGNLVKQQELLQKLDEYFLRPGPIIDGFEKSDLFIPGWMQKYYYNKHFIRGPQGWTAAARGRPYPSQLGIGLTFQRQLPLAFGDFCSSDNAGASTLHVPFLLGRDPSIPLLQALMGSFSNEGVKHVQYWDSRVMFDACQKSGVRNFLGVSRLTSEWGVSQPEPSLLKRVLEMLNENSEAGDWWSRLQDISKLTGDEYARAVYNILYVVKPSGYLPTLPQPEKPTPYGKPDVSA